MMMMMLCKTKNKDAIDFVVVCLFSLLGAGHPASAFHSPRSAARRPQQGVHHDLASQQEPLHTQVPA
jgi:hypothetical protein